MSALQEVPRVTVQNTGPQSVADVRSGKARRAARGLALAVAVIASLSTAALAAPAQAASAHGWSGSQAVAVEVPFSVEEIRTLQELGDFLGANSRITADLYASGNAYRS